MRQLYSQRAGVRRESSSAAHASNPPLPSLSSAENVTWDGSLPVDEYYSSNFAIFKHRQQPHVQSAPPPPPPPPPNNNASAASDMAREPSCPRRAQLDARAECSGD